MSELFNGDTEPETDYSVWGFEGEPPIIDGGSLNDDSHSSDAHAVAQADGWGGSAASYLVHDSIAFEDAVKSMGLTCFNMNEL